MDRASRRDATGPESAAVGTSDQLHLNDSLNGTYRRSVLCCNAIVDEEDDTPEQVVSHFGRSHREPWFSASDLAGSGDDLAGGLDTAQT